MTSPSPLARKPSQCLVETVAQRARRLGVSPLTVRRGIKSGKLRAVRIGGSVRFVAEDPTVLPISCTVRQVANSLSVSELTVRRWISSGELPAAKAHGAWTISRADLEQLLAYPVMDPAG